jgi:hypothetical protein
LIGDAQGRLGCGQSAVRRYNNVGIGIPGPMLGDKPRNAQTAATVTTIIGYSQYLGALGDLA